jgi:hypothetical protein
MEFNFVNNFRRSKLKQKKTQAYSAAATARCYA